MRFWSYIHVTGLVAASRLEALINVPLFFKLIAETVGFYNRWLFYDLGAFLDG